MTNSLATQRPIANKVSNSIKIENRGSYSYNIYGRPDWPETISVRRFAIVGDCPIDGLSVWHFVDTVSEAKSFIERALNDYAPVYLYHERTLKFKIVAGTLIK
jgi:hypothetical protein